MTKRKTIKRHSKADLGKMLTINPNESPYDTGAALARVYPDLSHADLKHLSLGYADGDDGDSFLAGYVEQCDMMPVRQ